MPLWGRKMKKFDLIAIIFLIIFVIAVPIGMVIYEHAVVAQNVIYVHSQENGGWGVKEIYAKVGQPITLTFVSEDVVHAFVLPTFNISLRIYPGHSESITFTPNKVGIFEFMCGVYCGAGHSQMVGEFVVEP